MEGDGLSTAAVDTEVATEYEEFDSHSKWGSEAIRAEHQVCVSDPETRQHGLTKHTTYLVSGTTLQGSSFSTRKRYNDFEWLKQALVYAYPGVFVPPIPRKQKMGRFEEHFVENRRRALEEFLQRIFNRPYLANSSTFKAWLQRGESGMEGLKREYIRKPLSELFHEYRNGFQPYLRSMQAPGDKDRLSAFKQYLTKHANSLKAIYRVACRVVKAHTDAHVAISELHTKMADLRNGEVVFVNDAYGGSQQSVRVDLSEVFYAEKQSLAESPSQSYDLLQSVVGRELRDVESMLEGIQSLDKLTHMQMQTRGKLEKEENIQHNIARHQQGDFLSVLRGKDKEAQLHDVAISISRLRQELQLLEEWIGLAKVVLTCKEMPSFTSDKVDKYRDVVEEFAKRQAATSLQRAELWSQFLRRIGREQAPYGMPPTNGLGTLRATGASMSVPPAPVPPSASPSSSTTLSSAPHTQHTGTPQTHDGRDGGGAASGGDGGVVVVGGASGGAANGCRGFPLLHSEEDD
ncbi:unnamed protein product [Vitrella brassicaformis CCMP3155]|uniref:PX domain-containing protein n=2 Tax=Vitrella brassicaformis TaxID=1169539 RepID=A0A0G4EGC4_VITBC|nr:unnamed protein product [Vitrella brassicaformis CCMP3155]|eukprot:CEL94523.1 unnamed protein product [Vitrella brassicaformis CCMP3155]